VMPMVFCVPRSCSPKRARADGRHRARYSCRSWPRGQAVLDGGFGLTLERLSMVCLEDRSGRADRYRLACGCRRNREHEGRAEAGTAPVAGTLAARGHDPSRAVRLPELRRCVAPDRRRRCVAPARRRDHRDARLRARPVRACPGLIRRRRMRFI